MSYTQKRQTVVSNSNGSTGVSGNVADVGNALIAADVNFAASSANVAMTLAFTVASLQQITLVSDKGCTIKTNGTGTADVQTITITGTPAGGVFSVDFGGQSTVIAYNAIASAVQTALQALSSIGSGNITCTGGPLPGTPVVCTFAGAKATGKQALMTAFSGALTGGSTPTVAITHTTLGLPSDTITLQPGIPRTWSVSDPAVACPFTSDVTTAYVSNTPAQRTQIQGLTS